MSKARGQRSIYVEEEDWEAAKELAWRKRISLSKLIASLLRKDAEEFFKPADPPRGRAVIAPDPEARSAAKRAPQARTGA